MGSDEYVILHVTTVEAWRLAIEAGHYCTPDLPSTGFIHFCRPSQLQFVLARYFAGQTGLVLLHVNRAKLRSPLKFESSEPEQLPFPHLYGPLNLDAVQKVESIR